MTRPLVMAAGAAIDLAIGDPYTLPHPVVWMGKLIQVSEKTLRRLLPATPRGERVAGGILWCVVTALSYSVPAGLLRLSPKPVWEVVMSWQVLALRGLRTESLKVYDALHEGDLEKARAAVARIVGRDTKRLDAAGVARAAVETVAENTSDGVVAPLCYLALGGAPLAMTYKAVNTMDSMLGYTDPPFTHIGRVAAKMDDLWNYLPARYTALCMLAAGGLLGLDLRRGLQVFWRDRYQHASPNAGQTESVCAGLLGLRLGGDAWYHGHLHKKPTLGDPVREITPEDIRTTNRLVYVTALLAFLGLVPLAYLTGGICAHRKA